MSAEHPIHESFDEAFADWLPRANSAQLRIVFERLKVAIALYDDMLEQERREHKTLVKEARAEPVRKLTKKGLPRKDRSDKGIRRKQPDSDTPTDQVTE